MSCEYFNFYIDSYCKPVQINSTGASFFSPTDSHSATPMPPRKEAPSSYRRRLWLFSQLVFMSVDLLGLASFLLLNVIFNWDMIFNEDALPYPQTVHNTVRTHWLGVFFFIHSTLNTSIFRMAHTVFSIWFLIEHSILYTKEGALSFPQRVWLPWYSSSARRLL